MFLKRLRQREQPQLSVLNPEKFSNGEKELSFSVLNVDVEKILLKITEDSLDFSLAVIDVPYGLKEHDWDYEVFFPSNSPLFKKNLSNLLIFFHFSKPFSGESFEKVVVNLLKIKKNWPSASSYFTLIVFLERTQQNNFEKILVQKGAVVDGAIWFKSNASLAKRKKEFIF